MNSPLTLAATWLQEAAALFLCNPFFLMLVQISTVFRGIMPSSLCCHGNQQTAWPGGGLCLCVFVQLPKMGKCVYVYSSHMSTPSSICLFLPFCPSRGFCRCIQALFDASARRRAFLGATGDVYITKTLHVNSAGSEREKMWTSILLLTRLKWCVCVWLTVCYQLEIRRKLSMTHFNSNTRHRNLYL